MDGPATVMLFLIFAALLREYWKYISLMLSSLPLIFHATANVTSVSLTNSTRISAAVIVFLLQALRKSAERTLLSSLDVPQSFNRFYQTR